MNNMWDRVLTLGLGAFALTREKAEALAEELIREGQITRAERQAMVRKLMVKGEESKREIQAQAEQALHQIMKKLDIPTRTEVDSLKRELEQLKRQKTGAKTGTRTTKK